MILYDIIGDIHGYATPLKKLLTLLEYSLEDNVYKHPTRKVIFLGDYIDRGPEIVEVLAIVKSMVDAGAAIALMGNHEYNAIGYNLKNDDGNYYRAHNNVHMHQHKETLKQFEGKEDLYKSYIKWFYTLPLFFEDENFRAIHACWENENIKILKQHLDPNNCLTINSFMESHVKNTDFHEAIEICLKGKELELPSGYKFADKDGHERTKIRIKWWENINPITYKNISVLEIDELPEMSLNNTFLRIYSPLDKPVFFGHYWLKGFPFLFKSNVCCLDYSIAKAGFLAAYRYSQEKVLNIAQFYYIK